MRDCADAVTGFADSAYGLIVGFGLLFGGGLLVAIVVLHGAPLAWDRIFDRLAVGD